MAYHTSYRHPSWATIFVCGELIINDIVKLKSSLADQIWFTRKARIRASERILSTHTHTTYILTWYSFLTFSLSIYLIKYPHFLLNKSDVIMTIATGAVFTLSLLIPQLDLKNRYLKLKNNYISLQQLNFNLQLCHAEKSIKEVNDDYLILLREVENQSTIDLYYFIAYESGGNCSRTITIKEWGHLISYQCLRTSILTLLYVLPIYLLIIYATI